MQAALLQGQPKTRLLIGNRVSCQVSCRCARNGGIVAAGSMVHKQQLFWAFRVDSGMKSASFFNRRSRVENLMSFGIIKEVSIKGTNLTQLLIEFSSHRDVAKEFSKKNRKKSVTLQCLVEWYKCL